MCKSVNEGVRQSLCREYTIGLVIDSSRFKHPYHPRIEIRYRDLIVGEEVSREKASELMSERTNIFLWETFVIYSNRTPRGPGIREEMRLYYLPRPFEALNNIIGVSDCVLGVPSIQGDRRLKEFLGLGLGGPEIGTCLVGYNLSRGRRSLSADHIPTS